jgi:hypothetical protein
MKALKYLVAASLTVGLLGSAFAADPAVKKASSGICHDSSSPIKLWMPASRVAVPCLR